MSIITFSSRKAEFRSLSNFWENPVVVSGITYPTGEHAFHGEKYRRLGEVVEDPVRKLQLYEYAQKFTTISKPADAKRMGGKRGLYLNDGEIELWNKLSVDVQIEICKFKLYNYPEVQNDLKKSGNAILLHPAMRMNAQKASQRFWEGAAVTVDGTTTIVGQNMLGKLWMNLR